MDPDVLSLRDGYQYRGSLPGSSVRWLASSNNGLMTSACDLSASVVY